MKESRSNVVLRVELDAVTFGTCGLNKLPSFLATPGFGISFISRDDIDFNSS